MDHHYVRICDRDYDRVYGGRLGGKAGGGDRQMEKEKTEEESKVQEITKEKWPEVAPDFIPLAEAMDAMRRKYGLTNIDMSARGGTVKVTHMSESEGLTIFGATKNEAHPDVYYVDAYNGTQTELGQIPCGEERSGEDGSTEGCAECAQAETGTEENHKFIWIEPG